MKSIKLAVLAFVLAPILAAQTQVVVKWKASPNAPGATYALYRFDGPCGLEMATAQKVNSAPITGLTYTDTVTTAGTFCYFAKASDGTHESQFSNQSEVLITPAPPQEVEAKTEATSAP